MKMVKAEVLYHVHINVNNGGMGTWVDSTIHVNEVIRDGDGNYRFAVNGETVFVAPYEKIDEGKGRWVKAPDGVYILEQDFDYWVDAQ